MVLVAGAGLPGKSPLTEALVAPAQIEPIQSPERGVREACSMGQQMFHRDRLLTVRAEGRNDVHYPFREGQLVRFQQHPDRRGRNGFGRGKDTEQALRGGRAEGLKNRQLTVLRHCHLSRREQPLIHFLAGSGEQVADFFLAEIEALK